MRALTRGLVQARRRWLSQPTAAVHGPHHYLGRRADDAAVHALRSQHHAPVRAGPQGEVLLALDKGLLRPADAVAALLASVRDVANTTGAILHGGVALAVPSWLAHSALAAPCEQAGLTLDAAVPDAVAALAGHLFLRGGLEAVLAADGPFLVRAHRRRCGGLGCTTLTRTARVAGG
jgi:hypothetical protein